MRVPYILNVETSISSYIPRVEIDIKLITTFCVDFELAWELDVRKVPIASVTRRDIYVRCEY